MIEIKDNKLDVDGVSKNLNEINVIKSVKNSVNFSNDTLECSCDIQTVHKYLKDNGLNNFMLAEKIILNVNNIDSLNINYYQYAGISIYQCKKEEAETYKLNVVFKNGKTESLSFSTHKDAEKLYHEIDNKIIETRSAATTCN